MNSNVIVVDGQHLNISRSGGAGRYCEQLFKRITGSVKAGDLSDFDICLLGFEQSSVYGAAVTQEKKSFVELLKSGVLRCAPPILSDRLSQVYQFASRTILSGANLKKTEIASYPYWFRPSSQTLLHEVTNYGMLDEIGRLSLSPNLRLVVSFLDIQDFYYPEYFQDPTLTRRRLAYSFYKERADFFLAISEFTKQTMVDRLGISPDKIKVTHLAANDMQIIKPSAEVSEWVKSFGQFWIYPAKVWKHKNHSFLLESLAKRKNELQQAGIQVLLTGGFGKKDQLYLERLISDNSLHDIVQILGFVSDEQLQALLGKAQFLVFPSLFEGFGMPILEAMTLGCPVLSSNAGSLPEVGGDAAIYFDPKNEEEFVSLIDSVLGITEVDRDSMIQKGFDNCKRFSWEKTYIETVDIYKMLLN